MSEETRFMPVPDTSLWEFVSLREYAPPTPPVAYKVRGGIVQFWRKFQRKKSESSQLLTLSDELARVPEPRLQEIADTLDWREAAIALNTFLLSRRLGEQPGRPVECFVNLPYGGMAEMLTLLAQGRQWRLCPPPTPEQILNQDLACFEPFYDDATFWIVPDLAAWYLRHACGLALVRYLFESLYCNRFPPGVLGCQSWAWAYFRYILHGSLPEAFVIRAFDHECLLHLFPRLIARNATERPLLFRQSDHGDYVLPSPPEITNQTESQVGVSHFLKYLAAYSRGIPEIARAVWRSALHIQRTDTDAAGKIAPDEASSSGAETIWVLPWESLKFPAIPEGVTCVHALVLHALLLHGALAYDLLTELLPCSSGEVIHALIGLKEAGLVEQSPENNWRVTSPGYPVVRQFLHGEGYLTDQF